MKHIFIIKVIALSFLSLTFVQAAQVPGKTVTYKGVTITQPVVASQRGAMCGYHALLNGKILFDALRAQTQAPARFTDGQQQFGAPNSPWLQFVLARDTEYQTGEMIEGDILSQLTQSVFKDINNHYAVVDADLNFLDRHNSQYNGTAQNQKKFWDNVRRYIRDTTPCSYMFLVNTSSCSEQLQETLAQGQQALAQATPGSELVIEGAEGQAGHWIVVYFHKNAQGVHQYYVADSAQGDYTGSRLVTQIIDRIEDPSPISAVKPQVMPKPVLRNASGAGALSAAVGDFESNVRRLISTAQQEEEQLKAALELSKMHVQTTRLQEEQDVQKAIEQSRREAEKRLQEQEQALLEQVRQQSLTEKEQRQQKAQTAVRELDRQRFQEALQVKREQQQRKQEEDQLKAAMQASIATASSVLSEDELVQQAIQESLRIAPGIVSEEEQLQQALQESLQQEEAASLAALFSQAWSISSSNAAPRPIVAPHPAVSSARPVGVPSSNPASRPPAAPRPPVAPRPAQLTQQQQQQAQQQRQETPQQQARRLAAEAAAQKRTSSDGKK